MGGKKIEHTDKRAKLGLSYFFAPHCFCLFIFFFKSFLQLSSSSRKARTFFKSSHASRFLSGERSRYAG